MDVRKCSACGGLGRHWEAYKVLVCAVCNGTGRLSLFRCRRCLYPNTKPDLWFDENGICSACLAYDARSLIDWDQRKTEFLELVRQNAGKSHDLIIACSGGKDSTAQIVKCLELGLRPLAVTATTDHLSELGRKNLDNVSRLCDHIEITPHKPTRNKIAKFALQEVGDISWCEHHLIWSVPARESVSREIPIVLYGECPQNEYGAGPKGSETQTKLTQEWVHEFGGLLGLRLEDVADILEIEPRHLDLYRRPEGAMAVFMGAYFPWDGYKNHLLAREHGFSTLPGDECVEGSVYGYENLDNLQTGIHDRLRFLKFGYSRACDIMSSMLRRPWMRESTFGPMYNRGLVAGEIRKIEGRQMETYLGVPVADILAPLGMTVADLERVYDRFTNKPVVEWALSPESYQCFYGTDPAAQSKEDNSATAASAA